MQQINWFERRFEFRTSVASFESLAERMAGASGLFQKRISGISEKTCQNKPEDKWSVREHLGHLSVLEPVWRLRFQDIRKERTAMQAADLRNRATYKADFNSQSLEVLCRLFQSERKKTLDLLSGFPQEDLHKSRMHPRLKQ